MRLWAISRVPAGMALLQEERFKTAPRPGELAVTTTAFKNWLVAGEEDCVEYPIASRIFDESDDDSNSESAPSPSSALQYYSSDDNGLSTSLVLFSTILCSAVQSQLFQRSFRRHTFSFAMLR